MVTWVISSIYAKPQRLKALHQVLFTRLKPDDTLAYAGNFLGFNLDVEGTMDTLLSPPHPSPVYLKGAVEYTLAILEHLHLQHKPELWFESLDENLYGPILRFYGFSYDFLSDIVQKGAVSLARFSEDFREALRAAGHADFFHRLKKSYSLPLLPATAETPSGLQKKAHGFTLHTGPLLSDTIYAVSIDDKTGIALQMIEV